MDGAIGERCRQGLIDAAVLLDEREPRERRRSDNDLEMVAAAGPVDHVQLCRVRERALEQFTQRLDAHRSIVPSRRRSPAPTSAAAPAATSITTLAPRRAAIFHGRRSGTTSITVSSRSQKIASIENLMKNMWIEPAG